MTAKRDGKPKTRSLRPSTRFLRDPWDTAHAIKQTRSLSTSCRKRNIGPGGLARVRLGLACGAAVKGSLSLRPYHPAVRTSHTAARPSEAKQRAYSADQRRGIHPCDRAWQAGLRASWQHLAVSTGSTEGPFCTHWLSPITSPQPDSVQIFPGYICFFPCGLFLVAHFRANIVGLAKLN